MFGQSAPTADQMKQMLDVSQRRAQLEMEESAPFHLVASYTSFDAQGKPAGTGKLDEIWESPKQYRRIWTLPAINKVTAPDGSEHFPEDFNAPPRTLVEVQQGTAGWRTGLWVMMESTMRGYDAARRPLYLRATIGDKLTYEAPPMGNASLSLDCVGTEPDLPGVPPETRLAMTTYCMSKGSHLLRLIQLPDNLDIAFDDVQQFGKKYVARTIRISHTGKLVFMLHVDVLEETSDFSELDAAAPEDAQKLTFSLPTGPVYGGPFMRGQLLMKARPLYPHMGLDGRIVVKVHVDTTGSVDSAEVISSTNQLLKGPMLAAVKNLKFRVSYQGKKVMPATWMFNFRMGDFAELQ
jgi:TonB family protein